MTALITLLTSQSIIGPFNIYSNVDGFLDAFANGITRDQLIDGYGTNAIPNGTTVIRIMSTGTCTNYIDITFQSTTCNLYDISAARATVDPGPLSYLSCDLIPVYTSLDIHAGGSYVICTSDTIYSFGEVDITRIGDCSIPTSCSSIFMESNTFDTVPTSMTYRLCDNSADNTVNVYPGGGGITTCVLNIISTTGPGIIQNVGPCS